MSVCMQVSSIRSLLDIVIVSVQQNKAVCNLCILSNIQHEKIYSKCTLY